MNEVFNNESWFFRKWRPSMAWLYMAICAFDFIMAPILFIINQAALGSSAQWMPITLQAGGIFHLSIGAIVGITAWSRGNEKVSYIEHFSTIKSNIQGATDIVAETSANVEPMTKDEVTK